MKAPDSASLRFAEDGARLFARALDEPACRAIEGALAGDLKDRPGVRIADLGPLAPQLAADGTIGRIAASILGGEARPVRAVFFDKTAVLNWALAWHQDRTIVVARRIDTPGFGRWTIKAGLVQCEPPFDLLERMVTLRVHLDPVDADNASLRILPGSHRLGRLPEAEIEPLAERLGERICLAGRGDVWLYATPIVHASHAAVRPRRRRVLQVDYAAEALPAPLAWLDV